MKKGRILQCAVLALVVCGSGMLGRACPPDNTDPGTPPDPNDDSNDPAFVMTDPLAAATLLQQQQQLLQLGKNAIKKSADLVAAEQQRYQAFTEAAKLHPDRAFDGAVAIWKGNDSADLQRLVLLGALEKTTSSDQTEWLQFMLKALDDPAAQRQECARLGRGNGLEKSIAAGRITLLKENPRLLQAMAGR